MGWRGTCGDMRESASHTTSFRCCGARMGYSRTGRGLSNCPATRNSQLRSWMSWACTWTLRRGAVILSVDEKTQVQALDRTQPLLPVSFGKTEKRTHDYKRNGTTKLFAALDTGTRGGDRQVLFPPPGPPVPQVHGRDSGQAPRQGNSCNPR